jgi:peptidoglycan/LPS O-acetylase OafA/YrhL
MTKMSASPIPLARVSKRVAIAPLTSVRFAFALWVLSYHLFSNMPAGDNLPRYVDGVVRCGYMGVSFFFVLSGFVLGVSYIGREFTARSFWQARAARILPMYMFALLLAAPLFFRDVLRHKASVLSAFAAPALIQAWLPPANQWNPAGWSLSCEAFFYLTFPLLLPISAKLFRSSMRWWVFFALWLAAALPVLLAAVGHSYSLHDHSSWLTFLKYNPLLRFPEFVAGVGLAVLYDSGLRIRKPLFTLCASTGISLAIMAVTAGQPYPAFHNGLCMPMVALFLYSLACMPKALNWPAAILLGEASYSLYLIHLTVLVIFLDLDKVHILPLTMPVAALYAAVCIGGSILTFRYIEGPGKNLLLGKALRKQKAREPEVPCAASSD